MIDVRTAKCNFNVGLTPQIKKALTKGGHQKDCSCTMTCCVVQVDNVDCALIVYFSALYNYFVAVVVWLIQLLEINKVTIKT